ncbi:MAG: hypothetical protein ACKPKO_37545 [Candidatus Fonsibacter sp.]
MIDATGFQSAMLYIYCWIMTKPNFLSSKTDFVTPSTSLVIFNCTCFGTR